MVRGYGGQAHYQNILRWFAWRFLEKKNGFTDDGQTDDGRRRDESSSEHCAVAQSKGS